MNFIVLFCLVISFIIVSPTVEGTCNVVPIQDWSGSASRLVEELPRPVELVVVTHTGTAECTNVRLCQNAAIAIRNEHMQQGMRDIGLSFLVGGNGRILEGAGWKVGNHTQRYNGQAISLSFIGDFSQRQASSSALNAAIEFLSCFLNNGHLQVSYVVVGHRQLMNTTSPGDLLQSRIETWPRWSRKIATRPL